MNPAPIKLKSRLRKLFHLIQAHAEHYDCVWDCCCDHGYLGMKLLSRSVVPRVEFVDCVPHLMEDLKVRLDNFNPKHPFNPEDYGVTCADAGAIALGSNQRHLIVLAGIGGELAATIIDNIIRRHQERCIDFLLCPNTAQFHLREYLIDKGFSLIREDFIREKRWNYEILHINYGDQLLQTPISEIGQHWLPTNQDHLAYLTKMQKHYSDQSKNCTTGKATAIAKMYQTRVELLTDN